MVTSGDRRLAQVPSDLCGQEPRLTFPLPHLPPLQSQFLIFSGGDEAEKKEYEPSSILGTQEILRMPLVRHREYKHADVQEGWDI